MKITNKCLNIGATRRFTAYQPDNIAAAISTTYH